MGKKLEEGKDYYFSKEGLVVLTKEYLTRRGYCCGNKCRHCPYQKKTDSHDTWFFSWYDQYMDDQSLQSQVSPVTSSQSTSSLPNQKEMPDQLVSSGAKESDPKISVSETYATEKEPVVEAELKEHGVEVTSSPHVPQLTMHDKMAGVSHSPSSDHPISPQTILTEQQAIYIEKTAKKGSSLSWLATLVVKHFKKLHGRLIGNES